MTIRPVTEADAQTVRELWEEFEAEVGQPPGFTPETWDEAWADLARHARDGVALLAESEDGAVGYAFARRPENDRAHITDVYVRPRARRRGLARDLMKQLAERARDLGAQWLSLDVLAENTAAIALYEELGFTVAQHVMAAPLTDVVAHAGSRSEAVGASTGAVYVQTDDQAAIVAAVARFVPRLYRSRSSVVSPPANGWVSVHDEAAGSDPALLRRLAQELSHVTGAPVIALGVEHGMVVRLLALERGSVLDEYLSVPDHFGPLPPGDAVALRANPTVLSRLTGAEPAAIRDVARTASSVRDLPPAPQLAATLAETLGLPPPLAVDEAAAASGAELVEH